MTTTERITFLKDSLQLKRHPEGGYFREVYRSSQIIDHDALPEAYGGPRNFSTSIYFMITSDAFSSFHKIRQDETWHFYEGSTISLYVISSEGSYQEVAIGSSPEKGEVFQFTVPGDSWFAAKLEANNSYALIGCTVAPGFDFSDFTLGQRDELTKMFPEHTALINELTLQ